MRTVILLKKRTMTIRMISNQSPAKPPRRVSHTLVGWLIRFSRLDKSRGSGIMKTKGDTVTCSQASKSYYKIADHSSAIEWSACFCGEKEQQNCY